MLEQTLNRKLYNLYSNARNAMTIFILHLIFLQQQLLIKKTIAQFYTPQNEVQMINSNMKNDMYTYVKSLDYPNS